MSIGIASLPCLAASLLIYAISTSIADLCPAVLSPNNIVPFDYRGDAHSRAAIFHSPLNPYDFPQSPDEHFGPVRDLGRKR